MPKIQRPPPGASSWNVDPESIVSLRDEQLSVRPSATVRDLEALIANHELDEVRVLSLATDTLDRVPENLGQLPRLEEIVINRCVAPREPKRPLAFSPGLWGCSRLKTLEISEGEDQPLEAISQLRSLERLKLRDCRFTGLPDTLTECLSLQDLEVVTGEWTGFKTLPAQLGKLSRLKRLRLNTPGVRKLPDSLFECRALEDLELHAVGISTLPEAIGDLSALRSLQIVSCFNLKAVPESVGKLTNLQTLYIQFCRKLAPLPPSVRNLKPPVCVIMAP